MKLHVTKKPESAGGGSNTFAWNFVSWARRNGHQVVDDIADADRAIVVAHFAEPAQLEQARARGCYVVHRIDEYFEADVSGHRRQKHEKIRALNGHTDVTVFQSEFVRRNAEPYLRPARHTVILNGADPAKFHPGWRRGRFIGHVTWGIDNSTKRLDLLYERILATPNERFLLVGRHAESEFDFNLPNVVMRGVRDRQQIRREYRKMKLLYFPSSREPCPNTVTEAIVSGVPVCYNDSGGTPEIVRDCGEPLERFARMLADLPRYREACRRRQDLHFDHMMQAYLSV